MSRSNVRSSARSNSFPRVPAGEAAATGALHTVAVRSRSAAVSQTSRSNIRTASSHGILLRLDPSCIAATGFSAQSRSF
jgi:hypothetical protein